MKDAKKMHDQHMENTHKQLAASSSVIHILNKRQERKKRSVLKFAHSWKGKAGKKGAERKAEDDIQERARQHREELKKMGQDLEKKVAMQKKSIEEFEKRSEEEFKRKLRQHEEELKRK